MYSSAESFKEERPVNRSHNVLRWDHSDLKLYYNWTYELFTPLWHDIKSFIASSNCYINDSNNVIIDQFYESMIQCLNMAATQSIVSKKINFFKYWWDAEGDALKEKSIQTHNLWKEIGRPKSGEIYLAKTKAKYEYKSYIASKTKIERSQISNSLHEALLDRIIIIFGISGIQSLGGPNLELQLLTEPAIVNKLQIILQ